MEEVAKKENPKGKPLASYGAGIFFLWIYWQFFEMPRNILIIWGNFLKFNLNYFSIPLLLKTLFSHWHRYKWYYPRGFQVGKILETFFSNLISRILGAILRIVLIFIGLLVEVFIFFGGLIIFIGWLLLPALLIAGFILGIIVIL